MKLRSLLVCMVFMAAAGLVVWFCRDEEKPTPRNQALSLLPQKTPLPAAPSAPAPSGIIPELSANTKLPGTVVEASKIEDSPDEDIPKVLRENSIAVASSVDPIILKRVEEERVPKVDVQSRAILFAMKLYREQFGAWPIGNSKTVSAALMGQNAKGVVFIEGHGWTNQQGELLDPWKMPYSFSFELNTVTVKSSGPNKVYGDTDDIIRMKKH